MEYLIAFVATFAAVLGKVFQHKNVINNLYRHMFVTSYVLAFLDVLVIGMIVRSDWTIAFASGTGAALASVTATYSHNRYMERSRDFRS